MRRALADVVVQLNASVTTASSQLSAEKTADLLCRACVDLLEVDGASISLIFQQRSRGTLGSSSEMSRRLDDLQFTFGEGPCFDAVASGGSVLVGNLDDSADPRWPAYREAARAVGVGAVFALPIGLTAMWVGALDLFCHRPGHLSPDALVAAGVAAELAALPLLDLLTADIDWTSVQQGAVWPQVAGLERVEVNQATGMIIAALDLPPHEALLRLRGYAFSHNKTASDIAIDIVTGRLGADLPD